MKITFELVDKEMRKYDELAPENDEQEEEPTVMRSNRMPAKPNWMNEHIDGEHFDEHSIAAPIVDDLSWMVTTIG